MTDDFIEPIESEGMLKVDKKWIPILVSVEPIRQTAKAYYATIDVYKVVSDSGRIIGKVWPSRETWCPKSMADNPYWICNNIWSDGKRVANRRFTDDYSF